MCFDDLIKAAGEVGDPGQPTEYRPGNPPQKHLSVEPSVLFPVAMGFYNIFVKGKPNEVRTIVCPLSLLYCNTPFTKHFKRKVFLCGLAWYLPILDEH